MLQVQAQKISSTPTEPTYSEWTLFTVAERVLITWRDQLSKQCQYDPTLGQDDL